MKEFTAYLIFDGNCREAMTFYQRCLGGNLDVMTFDETQPNTSPESKDRVMHARLINGSTTIMASDSMVGTPYHQGNNVSLSLACETDEEVDKLYPLLSEGGKPTMPPDDTFWNARFAMCTDRFGFNWMLNHERTKA